MVKQLTPLEVIERKILLIRGQKAMLDSDLAKLYGVTTKRLNEQVKRNKSRFPEDFMFQLAADEKAEVVANCDHLSRLKFSPVLPFAFTEHGAIMAASVLNTQRAADVSIYVVGAFVRLREMLSTHKELACKLAELEDKIAHHDDAIRTLIDAIKQLMKQPEPREKKIGFVKTKHLTSIAEFPSRRARLIFPHPSHLFPQFPLLPNHKDGGIDDGLADR